MKTLHKLFALVLLTSLSFLFSCNNEPYEGPIPGPNAPAANGELKIDFDGQTFISNVNEATIANNVVVIKGTKTSGAFFEISIPSAGIGSYSLENDPLNFKLSYSTTAGTVPFNAEDDDSGAFADFSTYSDNSQIVISTIDTVKKTISGTFKFTGVRFTDTAGTTIETKAFTSGSFTNLTYN